MTTKDFKVGQLVKVHPACDLFMRGVLHATVTKISDKYVWAKAHVNDTVYKFHPDNLIPQ